MADFYNPYNFVPAPPRNTTHPSLGDADATGLAGHASYLAERWTGRIGVRMRVATPLLVPDMGKASRDENGHWTYDVRVLPDGTPHIATTSVKGMLRSAYEAITNSRMAVLGEHATRLAYRMAARDGLSLVPAVFRGDAIDLLLGTTGELPSQGNHGWVVPHSLSYAAWLPAYAPWTRLRLHEGGYPQHGQTVHFWAQKVQHHRWAEGQRRHIPDFQYWEVVAISSTAEGLPPACPPARPSATRADGKSHHQRLDDAPCRYTGIACISNRNINGKHHERVFFAEDGPIRVELNEVRRAEIEEAWRLIVRSYQAAHREKELWGPMYGRSSPEQWLGTDPGKTAWSPHVYQDGRPRRDNGEPQPDAAELSPGTPCFVRARRQGNGYQIIDIYPVAIARALFESPPADLIDVSLRPATSLSQLSPADRVFGWVARGGSKGAYRGQVRLGPVRLNAHAHREPIERFGNDGIPLAILAQPKPEQARFYGARDPRGTPLENGADKTKGYRPGTGIRGRKVYPHHHLPDSHWTEPWKDRTQQAVRGPGGSSYHQEYRRPTTAGTEQRDDQNRSVRSWVRPGTEFSFDIDVVNVSDAELGALVWLLALPSGHHHRLGGGKPLGFGSVKIEIDTLQLANGHAEALEYRSLGVPSQHVVGAQDQARWVRSEADASQLVSAFKEAALDAYPPPGPVTDEIDRRFRGIPFVKAFLNATRGGQGKPTHYPRENTTPHPDGLHYEWFVANEAGARVSLPAIVNDDTTLPYSGT